MNKARFLQDEVLLPLGSILAGGGRLFLLVFLHLLLTGRVVIGTTGGAAAVALVVRCCDAKDFSDSLDDEVPAMMFDPSRVIIPSGGILSILRAKAHHGHDFFCCCPRAFFLGSFGSQVIFLNGTDGYVMYRRFP
jgi:hypothetical protein